MSMHGSAAMLAIATAVAILPSGASAQDPAIDRADRVAIFKAAGAVQREGRWVICADDPATSGAVIEQVRDLNGDGRPEAVVVEDGSFCHGAAGTGYTLLGRQPDASWKVIDFNSGVPEFLDTVGEGGWPDISVGGPGFCFPVLRWNGSAYVPDRHEYEGRRCDPE
jgi:hypothetical protein